MAEVIWNVASAQMGLDWQAVSAGSKPSGYVHPLALEAMKEKGLSVDGLTSKSSDQFIDEDFDLVVTVCGNARDACPIWPNAKRLLHWPFEDPADATGSDEQKMDCFRDIRDQIQSKIESFLKIESAFDADTRADTLKLLEMALIEDTGSATLEGAVDCTTLSVIPKAATATASFVSRADGTICGVEVTKLAIATLAPEINLVCHVADGDTIAKGDRIATFSGSAHQILMMERTCLNFMCKLSGISTLTTRFTEKVHGTKARVLDTRKTTPGYRRLEKYAVACGGGTNHRMGLYDAVMIKDNHLAFYRAWNKDAKDAIVDGIGLARDWVADNKATLPNGEATIVQLEVDTLEQFERALPCKPDIILLDNMSNEMLSKAVQRRDEVAAEILLEASGGVNLETIAGIAKTGVDRISIGALTHTVANFDIGLDWTIESATE